MAQLMLASIEYIDRSGFFSKKKSRSWYGFGTAEDLAKNFCLNNPKCEVISCTPLIDNLLD